MAGKHGESSRFQLPAVRATRAGVASALRCKGPFTLIKYVETEGVLRDYPIISTSAQR